MPQKIFVKVHPGARQNKIFGFKNGVLRVDVSAPPSGGKANKALIEILSDEFKVAKSDIIILRGETAKEKVLQIPDGILSLQNKLI